MSGSLVNVLKGLSKSLSCSYENTCCTSHQCTSRVGLDLDLPIKGLRLDLDFQKMTCEHFCLLPHDMTFSMVCWFRSITQQYKNHLHNIPNVCSNIIRLTTCSLTSVYGLQVCAGCPTSQGLLKCSFSCILAAAMWSQTPLSGL